MRVLFVSGIDGACHRYQVLHRARQVQLGGGEATVRSFVDPDLPAGLEAHDALFFYRVPWNDRTRALVERARDADRIVIGAIDDLIFDPAPELLPPLDHLPAAERALWIEGVERYRATLEACDAVIAPTAPLVEHARSLGWRAYLHRNALSEPERTIAERAREAAVRDPEQIVLGYASGTPTHDADLASIAPALADLLQEHPRSRLALLGPVALPEDLVPLAARIEHRPRVPWTELFEWLAGIDVNLAPLVAESPFARAKGEVKYLEAAAVETPTVASPTPAFSEAIHGGRNGVLAESVKDWHARLTELVREPELRVALGRRAWADLDERWCENERASELDAVLHRVQKRAAESLPESRWHEAVARRALEPDACPALDETSATAVSPPLGEERFEQRLRAKHDGLERIDLHAVTYGQALSHTVVVRLVGEDGCTLRETSWRAAELPDRAWTSFEFEPLPDSSRHEYTLVLETTGAGAGNAASFGLSTGVDGALPAARSNGEALAGPLALRGFAPWTRALAREAA